MIALRGVITLLARIPAWAWWIVAGLLVLGASYHMGRSHERKLADAEMAEYKNKQVVATVKIEKAEAIVVTKTETVYRDRIQKVYVQGAQIEVDIPKYIKPADDALFAVNAGFVRVLTGAWAGEVAGPAVDTDREPSGIPLSAIAAVEAGNITSCRAWRTQALGWREFYRDQQVAVNGAAGEWYHPPTEEQ